MIASPAGHGSQGAIQNWLLVVIVNYRTAQLAAACLRSLEPELCAIPRARAVVVENDSGPGEADALATAIEENGWQSWVCLRVAPRNGGFAYGNNQAIRPALASDDPPRHILLLNPDTQIFPGTVTSLLRFMDTHPEVGIAGGRFEFADGTEWPYAFRFHSILSELEAGLRLGLVTRMLKGQVAHCMMGEDNAQVDWVAGACMIVRREVFDEVGLLDEGYFLCFEETDFCLRARRAGWPCWYVPACRVLHHAGLEPEACGVRAIPVRRPRSWFESRRRYFLKNHGYPYALAADLAHNIGLTLWRVRRALQRKPDHDPPGLLRDVWAESVLFRRDRLAVYPTGPGVAREP
jgi:N-acetylglucosaminyl-diphospho-decaprenol L-rhamnosyltransferase